MTAPRPTLGDVAARAGVGLGTASRVLNGAPKVSARSREAVERAVRDLGYVPNPAARALVTRRTGAVALVISEPGEHVFSEPFFARVVKGVSAVLAEHSRQLVMVLADDRDDARLESFLSPQHVDGVLLLSLHGDDPLPRRLLERGMPVVLGGRPPRGVEAPSVDVDNAGGAREAVAHLLAGGRRRVAAVAGAQDLAAGVDRVSGYEQALRDAGVPVDPRLVVVSDFTEAGGASATRALLEVAPDLDAVFAANDSMAVGALHALRDAGRSVPGDVAVVGFDDSPLCTAVSPALTSVSQPSEGLGREMAVLLLAGADARADGGADAGADAAAVVLPTRLVVRASSAPAP